MDITKLGKVFVLSDCPHYETSTVVGVFRDLLMATAYVVDRIDVGYTYKKWDNGTESWSSSRGCHTWEIEPFDVQ